MKFEIFYNGNESGDWIVIKKDGKNVFSGHRLSNYNLKELLESTGAEVEYTNELTDEEVMDV